MKRSIGSGFGLLVLGVLGLSCSSSPSATKAVGGGTGGTGGPSQPTGTGGAPTGTSTKPSGTSTTPPRSATTSPVTSTTPPVTTSTPPNAALTVTVHVDRPTYALAPEFVGQNYEAFAGWGADVSLSAFQQAGFKAAGLGTLRYPGGSPGDWSDLIYTGKCTDGSAANWGSPTYDAVWKAFSPGGLAALVLQTNPTTQWCATGSQDASGAHAAAIAIAADAKSIPVIYEIGNEPDLGNSFFAQNETAYIAKFIEHANAIHGAVPTAKVYGPVVCGLGGNCSFPVTWDSKWIGTFLAATGNKATGPGKGTADGISFHVYLHSEWGYSDLTEAKTDLYGFAQYWPDTLMPYLRALIAKYDDRNLPVNISEVNIGAANSTNGNGTMSAVLRTLDLIAAFAVSGVHSFQWFDANAAGPSDFGMLTPTVVRPYFYAFAGWARMGHQVLDVANSANPHDVNVVATTKSDGSVQVLVINKTSTAHAVSLAFTGYDSTGKSMSVTTATSSDGTDTTGTVVFNGVNSPAPGAIPTPPSTAAGAAPQITVPPFSFAVVSLAK